MRSVDVKVLQDERGNYDIAVDSGTGDLQLVDGFDTAIDMSCFCERRADPSEMPPPELRRGWWGNLVGPDGFEIGSKLWLIEQGRKTQETLNKAIDFANAGLQWLVDDGHLESFEVAGEFTANGIRLNIIFRRSNSPTESRSFDLWQNTEVGRAI